MDFGKLANVRHVTTAVFEGTEFEIEFRGANAATQRKIFELDGVLDAKKFIVKPPEYLAVFVVSLRSGGDSFTPDLAYWLGADPAFLETVFTAVNEAINPPKSTANSSKGSSSAATDEA